MTRQFIESAKNFLGWMRGSSPRMTTVNGANDDTRPSQTRAAELCQGCADFGNCGGAVLRPAVRDCTIGEVDVPRRYDRAAQEADGDAGRGGERSRQSWFRIAGRERIGKAPCQLRRESGALSRRRRRSAVDAGKGTRR